MAKHLCAKVLHDHMQHICHKICMVDAFHNFCLQLPPVAGAGGDVQFAR